MGFERTEPIAMLRWPQNRRPSRSSDLCQLSSISVSGTSVSALSSAGADGEHRSCCPDSTVFWFGKMIVRKVCCPGRRVLTCGDCRVSARRAECTPADVLPSPWTWLRARETYQCSCLPDNPLPQNTLVVPIYRFRRCTWGSSLRAFLRF